MNYKQPGFDIKLIGLALGGWVATASGGPAGKQMGYIRGWILTGLEVGTLSNRAKRAFEKALRRLITKLRRFQHNLDIDGLCDCIRSEPTASRYEVLRLCVVVGNCSEIIDARIQQRLKSVCSALGLDIGCLAGLLQSTVSLDRIEPKDPLILLGIDPSMRPDKIREHLNRQYALWNARASSTDYAVRIQSERILDLVANCRLSYGL